jgi:hypothetical protein
VESVLDGSGVVGVKQRKLVARGRDLAGALGALALGVAVVMVKGLNGITVMVLLVCVLVAAGLVVDAAQ